MNKLEVRGLTHVYSKGTPFERTAIEDLNFSVQPGEFLGVIGHTGSGKSTMVQHLNGLVKPTSGQVLLDGVDIWEKPDQIRALRDKALLSPVGGAFSRGAGVSIPRVPAL